MPSVDDLKTKAVAEIDRRGDELIGISKTILDNPEPGFREFKTARTVAQAFRRFGIPYKDSIGITGLRADLHAATEGPTIAVMGELDSLKVLGHPHADPDTTAAHACGHHCQIGMMLGVAAALQADGVLENLSGRVALMAVPAEEYIEVEYRDDLRREGKLEFIGGKPEFIRLGALDDVDMAMMTHTSSGDGDAEFAGQRSIASVTSPMMSDRYAPVSPGLGPRRTMTRSWEGMIAVYCPMNPAAQYASSGARGSEAPRLSQKSPPYSRASSPGAGVLTNSAHPSGSTRSEPPSGVGHTPSHRWRRPNRAQSHALP